MPPITKATQITMKRKNKSLAMPAVAAEMPVKPNSAATSDTTRKNRASLSIDVSGGLLSSNASVHRSSANWLWDLVDRVVVGDAAQRALLSDRRQTFLCQQRAGLGVLDHRAGCPNRGRRRQPLHARGDVDGRTEEILAIVKDDREARSLVDADLQLQILAAAFGVQLFHRLAHAERGGDGMVGRMEGRHHRVANGLDHRAVPGGDNLVQHGKMRAHDVERGDVADPLIEHGRALEVGEKEGEAGNLEALLGVERVGAVKVAEGLVGQQPLSAQERME